MFYLIITALILLLVVAGLLVRAQVLIDIFTKSSSKRAGLSNQINGFLFVVFLVLIMSGFVWITLWARQYYLPDSASVHGVWTDKQFWVTMAILSVVFVVTHILLFTFPYIYQFKENRTALFYPVNYYYAGIFINPFAGYLSLIQIIFNVDSNCITDVFTPAQQEICRNLKNLIW